jgi:hypothetical protein
MNIEKSIFFMWAIWYFYTYGPPQFIHYYFTRLYFIYQNIFHNPIIFFDYCDIYSDSDSMSDICQEKEYKEEIISKPKYEDKYLDIIRQHSKEWQFTEDEMEEKNNISNEFYKNSLGIIKGDIHEISHQIANYKKEMDEDTDIIDYVENWNEYGDEVVEEITLKERNEYRTEKIKECTEQINDLTNEINTEEGLNLLKNDAQEEANLYIINKRIEKLQNCYVMEKTPQGNVLMMYDKDRESFKYYSDSTIPYRYLEVVGRKYVKLFNCRPLFADMEEELKLCDEKWTKDYELKKAKEAQDKLKAEEAAKNNKPTEQKRNIFAKFKSYNKEAGGKISMAAPPKNSIPNKAKIETKEDEKILLKEKANRYTYEGKFANFNFLQKIERKVFNKKLGITFADFKKMQK